MSGPGIAAIGLAMCAAATATEGADAGPQAQRDLPFRDRFLPDVFSYRLPRREQTDLNGVWELRRDPDGVGLGDNWHAGAGAFSESMTVPGAPQAQGIGEPHHYQRTCFMEPFWIRRTFPVRAMGPDECLWLRIGGILPAAEVYINGELVGFTKSSRTQRRVDVTEFVHPDEENRIAIKVCDLPEVRLDGLLEWNEGTQKWTGPYRPIYCEYSRDVALVDAYVRPCLDSGTIQVQVWLTQPAAKALKVEFVAVDGEKRLGRCTARLAAGEESVLAEVALKSYEAWSPNHPKLYTLEIALHEKGSGEPFDRAAVRFGMREIATEGTKFVLNGSPVFLRCFGDDHYYPDTLCPPADVEWYRSRLETARRYGMNAMKGCVESTPQEYIEACDEAGILIIQEMPFGLSTLRANRCTIDERFREYYAYELDGLVRVSRNHPSVVAYSMSSEMNFAGQTQESFDFYNRTGLPDQTRRLAPHALVIDCTGYLNTIDTDKGARNTDFYASVHPLWMKDVLDETDMETDRRVPLILHEYNWWSNYPDPADKAKYANAQLIPFWLDTLLDTAWQNGQGELIPLYHQNSLWLQALARKDGIEYARRNRLIEGYILWLLIDFGHWAEGLLDDFWNPKNVSPEEFLKSNGDTAVLLAEEGERCLAMGAPVGISLGVSHYGPEPLTDAVLAWRAHGPHGVRSGRLSLPSVPTGEFVKAGSARFDLPVADKSCKLELEVALHDGDTLINTNNWSFWAFPNNLPEVDAVTDASNAGKLLDSGVFVRLDDACGAPIPSETTVVVAAASDELLTDYLDSGGTCLLFPHGSAIENTTCYYGDNSFYPIFRTIPWNAGSSGNSGTVISAHPAMEAFPHEGMCDLPFVTMMRGFLPMEFSELRPHGVTPIIRGIDHYYSNRNNAHLLEFAVGNGKVLACSLGVLEQLKPGRVSQTNWSDPAAFEPNRTLPARYLLKCLLDYARGEQFAPTADVPADLFLRLFATREEFKEGGDREGALLE